MNWWCKTIAAEVGVSADQHILQNHCIVDGGVMSNVAKSYQLLMFEFVYDLSFAICPPYISVFDPSKKRGVL